MKQWQKYVAEVLGTFTLVFIGSVAILAAFESQLDLVLIAFGFGLALMAGLYAFGEVSGGHFNPAVSLAMFLDRRLPAGDLFGYWLAQFAGAILASLAVLLAFTDSDDVARTVTSAPHGDWRAFVLEIIATAIFVAVILESTRAERHRGTALISIPLTLAAIHLALIPHSGSSVNPARSLAPTLIGWEAWGDIWIYLVAPPIGAIAGWVAHAVTVRGDTNLRDDFERAAGDMRTARSGRSDLDAGDTGGPS